MQISSAALALRYRILSGLYLACVLLASIALGYVTLHDNNNRQWTVGDWLINYQGGFVRRGLIGQALLHLSRWTHVDITTLAITVPVTLYAIVVVAVWLLLRGSNWNLWVLLLLFSPATLAFHILDFKGGYRKEILFLAVLAALVVWLSRAPRSAIGLAATVSVACAVCLLSHEGLLCFMPYLAAAVFIVAGSWKRALAILVVPVLLSAIIAREVTQHHGDRQTATAICESTVPLWPKGTYGWCKGSIQALMMTPDDMRKGMRSLEEENHIYLKYGVTGILALLPVIWGCRRLWRHGALHGAVSAIVAASLLAWCASIPLFRFGYDWGRWIYIHVMCLFLLLLFVDHRRQQDPATAEAGPELPDNWRTPAGALLLLAYMSLWNLPYHPTKPVSGTAGLAVRAWRHELPR